MSGADEEEGGAPELSDACEVAEMPDARREEVGAPVQARQGDSHATPAALIAARGAPGDEAAVQEQIEAFGGADVEKDGFDAPGQGEGFTEQCNGESLPWRRRGPDQGSS